MKNKNTPDSRMSSDDPLTIARRQFASLQSSVEFSSVLLDNNVDDINNEDYWHLLSGVSVNVLDSYYETNSEVPAEALATALLCSAPSFLIAKERLKAYEGINPKTLDKADYELRKYYRERACTFNMLIKHVAKSIDVRPSDLRVECLAAATSGFSNTGFSDLLPTTDRTISDALRSMRHEVIFERMVQEAGLPYRDVTVAEDLKGADIILTSSQGDIVIDVKSSLDQLEHAGTSNAIIHKKTANKWLVWSMVADKSKAILYPGDPDDSFTISQQELGIKAEYLKKLVLQP